LPVSLVRRIPRQRQEPGDDDRNRREQDDREDDDDAHNSSDASPPFDDPQTLLRPFGCFPLARRGLGALFIGVTEGTVFLAN
jgi:hypothetical protein